MRKNVKDLDEMRCAYPDKLNMKKIAELKEEEICDAGKRIMRLSSLVYTIKVSVITVGILHG